MRIPRPTQTDSVAARPPLPSPIRFSLQAASLCDTRTVDRWWRGERITPASAERLNRAAREIGFVVPPLTRAG